MLGSGEVDIGLLRHPFDTHGLRVSTPLAQPLGVLMHREHPLADREKVALPDLQPYELVLFQRHVAPGLYDELLELARLGGYVPPKILHAIRMTAALTMNQLAVTFVPERVSQRAHTAPSEITWKPLEGTPIHWWTSVVTRSHEKDRIARLAVNVVLNSLQEHEDWVSMPRPAIRRTKQRKQVA